MMSNPNRVLRSWVDVSPDSDFSIHNIPFGIGRPPGSTPRLFTAIGQYAADLQVLAEHGFFDDLDIDRAIFSSSTLNPFIALGREKTRAVRQRLIDILDDDLDEWDASQLKEFFLLPQTKVSMLLPLQIGDYTDFYSSREHATNVGAMFRDPQNALLPNWLHLPVAYHGRASSIVVSGTPIRRPQGQTMPDGASSPQFGPSRLLDFELEMAFVIGRENAMGHPVSTADAEDYIFGLVLFNDWSARDIQRWEYQPLGPFLSKNFASTISPWVVTLDALEPFRCTSPEPEIAPLPYLQYTGNRNFDIQLEVALQTASGAPHTICRSNFRYLYWNMSQQLAHHTINGCPLRIGDLCASGTISGPNNESYGSMLELTWRGTQPIQLPDGSERRFLHDGDTVIMRGFAQKEGIRVGFGEARGTLIPALQ
ncbi:MAG: fumarylacetoacetase [Lewinellaceae bacterium]|nr:fumarylacetoacetase [Lewinellaceae bacterium]